MDKYQFDFSTNAITVGINIEKTNVFSDIIQKLLTKCSKKPNKAIGHHLHCISHKLRDFMYAKETDSVQIQFYITLQEVVESVKNIYDILTKKDTATCIKLHEKGKSPVSAITFCRDTQSFGRSGIGNERDASTLIRDNSDFQMLHESPKSRSVFVGHNLKEQHEQNQYLNSHNEFWRYYQSTVVWPIRAFRSEKDDIDITGYLCVDCLHPCAFNKDDIDIGASIADALYVPTEFYSEIFH